MKNKVLFFLLIIGVAVIAQELPTIIPPSPEARKIIEYGNVPLNYATGVPNINAPLYNLNLQGYSIPISLSYHASGVKVDDDEGQVGLKWTLSNGGGRISRTINGRPDEQNEHPNAGWFNMNFDLNLVELDDLSDLDKAKIAQGCYDFQPDEFHYNLPNGVSGKFLFDANKQIVLIPNDSSVSIDFNNDYTLNSGFTITDQRGHRYEFGSIEYNTVYLNCSGRSPCNTDFYTPSSWMLDRVLLQNGDQITYTYSHDTYKEDFVQSQSQVLATPSIYNDGSLPAPDSTLKTCTTINTYNIKLLQSISYKNFQVVFQYSDKPGSANDSGKKLDNFKVFNLGHLVEGYQFNYTHSNRMFLDNIKRIGSSNTLQDYYSFEYNDLDSFPEKGSFSKDHFGYNNGVLNTKLIPGGVYETPYIHNGTRFTVSYNGANRDLSEPHLKKGILTKLIYPTKGWAEFDYEPNEGYYGQYETSKKSISYSRVPDDDPLGWQTHYSNWFTTNFGQVEFSSFKVFIFDTVDPGLNWGRPSFQIIDNTGEVHFERTLNFRGENYQGDVPLKINLPKDRSYRIKLNIYNSNDYVYNVRIIGNAKESNLIKNKYYGGLRVTSIKNYDHNSELSGQRAFSYNKFDASDESSGKAVGKLRNYEDEFVHSRVVWEAGSSKLRQQKFKKLLSGATQTLAYTNNSPLIYENVEEKFIGKNDEAYTIKRYFKNHGINRKGFSFETHIGTLFSIPTIEDYANGILIKEEYLDAQRRIVKTTENSYEFKLDGTNRAIVGATATCYRVGGVGEYVCHITTNEYLKRWFVNTSTTNTNFYNDKTIIETNQKLYQNGSHKQPTQTEITDSENKKIITRTKYPGDISVKTAAEQKLIDQYRIATPIEVTTIVQQGTSSEQLVSKIHNEYKNWSRNIIALQKVQAAQKGYELEDRIEYLAYDTKGNPLEVSMTNGIHIIYIWGYKDTQPIVKIDNASYTGMPADVTTLINQLKEVSDNEDTSSEENTIRNLFKQLRNHPYFSEAQINSYTYDPLIGVTSITDPQGYTIYYTYDDFNRLKFIKDADGNLVSENLYNYKK
ncbi:RHS repeat domain-containing protein [Aquimarina sp. 2201CG5-10]|uniref:RHS repeat domain-containing protein n=1 Tax=Aquimarina callyspongiae TaxID=3098150 RepID=UPI002AB40342|nr:RHS repeat domain-containing protein [Aquimarina sp. 2201CG5-10]MDY8138213.1 RHS repeat domain-containing protein [Aquimarina sp. 2201CG5-10]